MGLGTGAGFVAGIDLVRSGKGGPFWQGAYGGATMAAGGLALMVVPQLVGSLGWRAPYWTGLVLALARRAPRPRGAAHRRATSTPSAHATPAARRDRRPPALAARRGADRDLRALGRGGKLDRDPARARGPRPQHLRRRRRARPLRRRRHPAGSVGSSCAATAAAPGSSSPSAWSWALPARSCSPPHRRSGSRRSPPWPSASRPDSRSPPSST